MFHGLAAPDKRASFRSHGDAFYTVPARVFITCLERILELGLETITTQALAVGSGVPTASVFVTFDDGLRSDYTRAFPALVEVGMAATFFVVTDWLGTEMFVDRCQLREMADGGMDIQVHGKSHRFLSELSSSELRQGLAEARPCSQNVIRV